MYLPRGYGVQTPKPDAGVASKRPNSQSKRNLARPGLGVAGPWLLEKRVAVGCARGEQIRRRLVLAAALEFSERFLFNCKNLIFVFFFFGEDARTSKTHGPLIDRIWDPSPET